MNIDNDLQTIIEELDQGGVFDSHNVLDIYRMKYPAGYVPLLTTAELRVQRSKRTKKPSAVHCLHTALGIRIARLCKASGLSRTPSRSRDVNGQQSCCLSWSRPVEVAI